MEQGSRVCPVCPNCKSNKNVIPIIYGAPEEQRDKRVSKGWFRFLQGWGKVLIRNYGMGQYYCRSCRIEW